MASSTPSTATPIKSTRFTGCSSIADYEVIAKLGEGTFGEVHKARSRATGKIVALKKILMHNEKDGFPITALREVKLLKTLCHVNILKLEEMAIERAKTKERKKAIMYMVTPYMDHDLSGLLDNPDVKMSEPQIKCYMLQLLEGLRYLHSAHILHRDMKAANLLISNTGILQIADFGLARYFDEPSPKPGKGGGEAKRDYTALVVTRWYRPPELLLGLRKYTSAIDLWGVGCVFGEMFKKKPILSGKSDVGQAHIIFDLVGSPNDENMPGWGDLPGCDGTKSFDYRAGNIEEQFKELSPSAMSLLRDLLTLNWRTRINAYDAMRHPYFTTDPFPARPHEIPRYNDSHELDRRRVRDHKAAAPPPAPVGGAVGMGPEGEYAPQANGGPGRDLRRGGPGWAPDDRDRGPPRRDDVRGPRDRPPPSYDSRRPAHAGGPPPPPPERRPGWTRPPPDSLPPRPPIDSLPPRPPPAHDNQPSRYNDRGARNGPPGQDRPRNAAPPVDTYIPAYASTGPPDHDGGRDRRDYRDRDYVSRPISKDGPIIYDGDRLPPRRYNDRDRGRDDDQAYRGPSRPNDERDRRERPGGGGGGLPYGEGANGDDRPRMGDRERDRRRTRSRSPVRERRDRESDRGRGDRNLYGRR